MAKYGIVVVGLGIAGGVRVRDISDPRFNETGLWKLLGVVTRRALESPPAPVLTEDEMLKRDDINVVVVCTEPSQHEHIIRKALDNGKHVLVEFPVVPSASVTKQFYEQSSEKGLVLHEENIALLTDGYHSLKRQLLEAQSPVVKGRISLIGSYNGWAEDFEGSGGPFCVNVSMIQTLYELFGDDLKVTGGDLERSEDGFTATARFTCNKCHDLTLSVSRTRIKGSRKKTSNFELADGTIITENPEKIVKKSSNTSDAKPEPGLFMQDFLLFMNKVEKITDGSRDVKRTIACIQLAEDIHRHMGLKSGL